MWDGVRTADRLTSATVAFALLALQMIMLDRVTVAQMKEFDVRPSMTWLQK